MKTAADRPEKDVDVDVLWRRGKGLRIKRALGASTLALLILSGGAWAAFEMTDQTSKGPQDTKVASEENSSTEHCRDKDWGSDEENVRYCIASGSFEGFEWSWFAYYNNEGDLCDSFTAPDGGGGSCGPYQGPTSSIGAIGLSGGGVLDPMFDATLSEDTEAAFVETSDGERLEMNVYVAPQELGISRKYALYFHLPRDAVRVVAVSSTGEEIGRASLNSLLEDDPLMGQPDDDGWVVASDLIGEQRWTLSADRRQNVPIHCVVLNVGNDTVGADPDFETEWCSDSTDTDDLLLEQVWWSELKEITPIFGSVSTETSSATLELDDGSSQDIPILESPKEFAGTGPYAIYFTDFLVVFPPLGSNGEVVARSADGTILSTWDLCLDPAATQGVEYTACDETTEFWLPPE